MSLDDLPLHRAPESPAPGPPRPGSSQASRWLIVGAAVVVAGSLLALRWMSRAQPPAVELPPVAATDPAAASRRPPRQPLELPPLAASDAMLRELVTGLSRHPMLARFLATRGLVRSVTLSVVQIGDGRTPAQPLAVLRPPTRLEVSAATGHVEPSSYVRWESVVRALQSLPARDCAQVYVNVKPLFDEAYRELGYPDGDFDQAIAKAIRMLQATPEHSGDLALLRRDGYFEHEDPALRSLPPVQKQLLLMGPENRARILAWLGQLAATLELRL
jgi:hypothetical protein